MDITAVGTSQYMPRPEMKPPKPQDLIADKDADGDGALSIEEFSIPEDKFTEIDTDGDGLLTLEEFEADLENKMAEKQGMGLMGPMMMENVSQMVDKLIADKDEDEDGALSLEEFGTSEEEAEKFSEIDTDGDGVISAEELEADITAKMAEAEAMMMSRVAMMQEETGSSSSAKTESESSSGSGDSAGSSEDSGSVEIVGNNIDDDGDGEIDEMDSSSVMMNLGLGSYTGTTNQSAVSVWDLLA